MNDVKDSLHTCRHCGATITYRTVEQAGYLPRTGWADDAPRDALVCFRALDYAHVPDTARTAHKVARAERRQERRDAAQRRMIRQSPA